jgi:hypothetical protein
VLNRVLRHLTAGLDFLQREAFDAELYAPAEGWDAAEHKAFAAMADIVGDLDDG